MLRLLLVPFFIGAFMTGRQAEAFWIFCIAGFTDLIDGSVARLLKQHSKSGALLDPIADKLLMQSAFIVLVISNILPLWFLILALLRDIMIMSGISYLVYKRIDFAHGASNISKFATLLQLLLAAFGLYTWWKPDIVFENANTAIFYKAIIFITAVLIVVSGVKYIVRGISILKGRSEKS